MKKFAILIFFLCTAGVTQATVFPKVFLADGITPLPLADPQVPYVYRDIMVGTRLTIILESDSEEDGWCGCLILSEENTIYGYLWGRDYDGLGYPGSCLPAAGLYPNVWDFVPPSQGLDFYTGFMTMPGEWFAADYDALTAGTSRIDFYKYHPFAADEYLLSLQFNQVPNRDFNGDYRVNYSDFSILAKYWVKTGFNDPNDCQGADLDSDHDVDSNDLKLFSDFWLVKQ